MNKDKLDTVSKKQKAEAVSQAMKLIIDCNDSSSTFLRSFLDEQTLMVGRPLKSRSVITYLPEALVNHNHPTLLKKRFNWWVFASALSPSLTALPKASTSV